MTGMAALAFAELAAKCCAGLAERSSARYLQGQHSLCVAFPPTRHTKSYVRWCQREFASLDPHMHELEARPVKLFPMVMHRPGTCLQC